MTAQARGPLRQFLIDRIREYREANDLSQAELAERAQRFGLNWHRHTVADLEAGRGSLSIEDLILLPKLLGAELPDLLGKGNKFSIGGAVLTTTEILRLLKGESKKVVVRSARIAVVHQVERRMPRERRKK